MKYCIDVSLVTTLNCVFMFISYVLLSPLDPLGLQLKEKGLGHTYHKNTSKKNISFMYLLSNLVVIGQL